MNLCVKLSRSKTNQTWWFIFLVTSENPVAPSWIVRSHPLRWHLDGTELFSMHAIPGWIGTWRHHFSRKAGNGNYRISSSYLIMSSFFNKENLQVSLFLYGFPSISIHSQEPNWMKIWLLRSPTHHECSATNSPKAMDGHPGMVDIIRLRWRNCFVSAVSFTHQFPGVSSISRRGYKNVGCFLSKQLFQRKHWHTFSSCLLLPSAPDIPNCSVDAATVVVPAQHNMLNLPPCHLCQRLFGECLPKQNSEIPKCLSEFFNKLLSKAANV